MAEGVGAGGLKTYTLGGDGAPATLTVRCTGPADGDVARRAATGGRR